MKKWILFLLTLGFVSTDMQAQSLKDLLYSGKLKKDSNVVIRKGDDLSARIDTGTKKPEAEVPKTVTAVATDSTVKKEGSQTNTAVTTTESSVTEAVDSVAAEPAPVATTAAPAKNNNQLWKEYIDSLSSGLKTEVLSSKKIKKETYYLYVEYEIGTDGQVGVSNVVSTPENSFLQDQVKERINLSGLKLYPVLDSAGKPRKVKRKYNFNITKE